jgi:hypothetical protein
VIVVTNQEDREKAISNIVKLMKESMSFKDLTDEQWASIQYYVMLAFIDGKDYAVSKYILKDTAYERELGKEDEDQYSEKYPEVKEFNDHPNDYDPLGG